MSFNFTEHFLELKKRLLIVVGFFLIMLTVSYFITDQMLDFLLNPMRGYFTSKNLKRKIIYTSLTEGFFTYIKIAVYFSLFTTLPILIYQIYQFISPGLKKSEKKIVWPVMTMSPFLFFVGVAIVYLYVLPQMIGFFMGFEQNESTPLVLEARISEYLTLCLSIMFAFGLSFQMPVLIIILAKIGLVTSKALKKSRRFSIVLIFIVGAVLTPPDILSQITLAGILIILYELSIIFCKYVEKTK